MLAPQSGWRNSSRIWLSTLPVFRVLLPRSPQSRSDDAAQKKELSTMLQLVDEAEAIVTSPGRSLDDFGRLLHEGLADSSEA